MTTPQLPERPNLEQLKRQAKELLRDARAGDANALARFRTLPAFATTTDDEHLAGMLALHDAQSVIARDLGFPSWKALAARVEELTLGVDAAIEQFILAATEVQPDRAARLLELHPRIADANFHTALLLGDAARVEAEIARRPALATEAGGPRDWPPLLYLCHTSLRFGPDSRRAGIIATARVLLGHGADPNAKYPWLHHGVRRPALWAAVCSSQSRPLAELLLEAGADPNDGVTFPLAAGGGDIASLELLHTHGADVNQPWASDGSSTLYSLMSWSDTPTGIHWLLEHGADPDPVFAPNGETPLHVAARRWQADVAAALVRRGADVSRRRADGRTPYEIAELSGNTAVAAIIAEHGGATELRPADRLVAAAARGDRKTVEALLEANRNSPPDFAPEHYAALYNAADRGDARVLELMLLCGLDPNRGDDEIGKTALHAAAMEGQVDAVRVLLAHGASTSVRDREFHGQPLVWAAEGSRSRGQNGHNYDEVGRLLLKAGSPVDWQQPNGEPAESIIETITRWQRSLTS
jgi:ankyrin repeat protein